MQRHVLFWLQGLRLENMQSQLDRMKEAWGGCNHPFLFDLHVH